MTSFKLWITGQMVGESQPKHFTKRVYQYSAAKFLKPGKNMVAVEAVHTLDPLNPGYATAAGLTVRFSSKSTPKSNIPMDESWKSSDAEVAGFEKPNFNDADWKPVRPWRTAKNFPWLGSIWDSAISEQLGQGSARNMKLVVGGNVRDYFSFEGYPMLDSLRGIIPKLAGDDPSDDATFLRNPASVPKLNSVGLYGAAVGVPLPTK
ncbi:MAG: hypothetical protein ACRCZF_25615 [Gemmataceae bacterium]